MHNRRIFVYTFCLINICLPLSDDAKKRTIHQMVSEKCSSKSSKFYRECMALSLFCHTAILQFLMADMSFNVACKELKIVQIAQLNQLCQLLHVVHICSNYGFYELIKSYANEENVTNDGSKDSPIV